jgi:invasion protein IalB
MKNQTERLVIGGALLLVGLVVGWMVRGVATYNPKAGMVATYDDWRVACPGAEIKQAACELVTDVIDKAQGNPVARVTVTTDPKDNKRVLGFTLPYGVALTAGMGLVVGKDPVKVYPYRTCNTVGCIAVTDFDDKLAASLKAAPDARVMFASLDGKPVAVAMSLKGFKTALGVYKSAEAKRHSWFWRLFS